MPIFAGLLGSLFSVVFSLFAKRLAMGLAAASAFLVVAVAALAASKLALFALIAGISLVVPTSMVSALVTFMPTHASLYIGLILLAQSIMVAFDYWKQNLAVAFQLANS